jgi:outer membrane protein assembly factor BamD (BamD/ComL family)
MKKSLLLLVLFAVLGSYAITASAQGNVKSGPEATTLRDPELEKDSLHNLEVARHYFKLKKAYVAALKRCEEIDAGNPTFAKMDEVLFIAGESYFRLSENKGKQTYKDKKPEELRTEARVYLSRLASEFPQSPFNKQAEDDLQALGGALPKTGDPKP